MASDTETLEADAQFEALKALVNKKYEYIDRKWDAVFWVSAAFIVGAAADITMLLFAGDWDFWTDWKDRVWWPILTPFSLVIIGSALQYIQWLAWGVPAGIFADWVLMKTKSFVLTSLLGSMLFAFTWWVSNYVMVAPYLQPAQWMDRILTVSDIQGIAYIRSQTPEYLRIVEHGTLRSFLGETQYVSIVFGMTVAIAGYWIGQFIGRMLAIWPIGRFMKKW